MREIAETLDLDLLLIRRDLDVHRAVGTGYLAQMEVINEKSQADSVAFAATSFRRAGAHALLLDDVKLAQEMFTKSAECYARLRRPYAAMMWSLAQNLDSASRISDEKLSEFVSHEGRLPTESSAQLIYSLLLNPFIDRSQKGDQAPRVDLQFRLVWRELDASSTSPVGILGIPMLSYLRLAESLEDTQSELPQAVFTSLLPFLNAYDLAFEIARSKTYHWRRLLMPFHPLEPDILSLFVVADRWLRKRNARAIDFVREHSGSRSATKLLAEAIESIAD